MFTATGRAEAMGHHGELVQGLFEDTGGSLKRALVSLPCPDLRARASFQPDEGNRIISFPPDRQKALRAAELTAAAFGPKGMGGALSLESNIPIGRGMGSSTADVLASILAVADCLQIKVSAEQVMHIAVCAETACDSTLFQHQAVLFAHREGLVVESFRKALPPIEVISIDTMPGSTVDTLEFEPARYDPVEIEAFRPIRSLLRAAINAADARLLGKAATASAHINERFLPKPRLDEIEAIGARFGAVGVQVAHSGTVVGLMFDKRDVDVSRNIGRAFDILKRSAFEPTIFHN
ncbi:GHMP kinase [Mesorhizobium sp. CO1-1-8]|uniref:GHMP family kinase ATP-binding protein n=1 Tax=Mesorhizobium sp. CO1-1-8 TaxID=2876631 RepID=UPI001CD06749|nr:GHMP kinase [Mesorhizobium sp. CO1-1-8]MBZ9772272.1 GHMP kinase [Mesorhizobium sp. CO1-1-8]